jgi:hypothetical protein
VRCVLFLHTPITAGGPVRDEPWAPVLLAEGCAREAAESQQLALAAATRARADSATGAVGALLERKAAVLLEGPRRRWVWVAQSRNGCLAAV